jgi:hypothetical protein
LDETPHGELALSFRHSSARYDDLHDDLHVYGVGDEAILTLMISPTFMAGSERSTPCYRSNDV